jgi:Na+-transporting NADH:ubiquinone oxidoreductase subunit F
MMQLFTVKNKKALTHDVYEIAFEWENNITMKPWQFVTFIIDKIWGRAYSILEIREKRIVLIIKKREIENGGRWGSKYICEMNIWDTLKWVGPAGHFLLQENEKNKLFIGTGTGLVPLYSQIIGSLEKKQNWSLHLIFWVRTQADLFYVEQLQAIQQQHSNFSFSLYLSKEDIEWTQRWYITDFLTQENLKNFEEFYICGTPAMIDSTVDKLKSLWMQEDSIFLEKYS